MTDEFQAAPPETGLREREVLRREIRGLFESYRGLHGFIYNDAFADEVYALVERRLSRPEALREKVMAVIDEWWRADDDGDIDVLKAAVAGVWEEPQ